MKRNIKIAGKQNIIMHWKEEKLCQVGCQGFEPGTSSLWSECATNWAILPNEKLRTNNSNIKAKVKLTHIVGQHDVTVDHTMLSGVVKLSNLQCSTICDNVCWTMLRGYIKLTYICWTTNQIYIAIICCQFFIRKDSSVGSTLAS